MMISARHQTFWIVALTGFACSASADETTGTPGVLVQIYDIQENMERVYPLLTGQLPNVARIMPTFDLRGKRVQ